jgi:glycosyltransferase involved in cell wall biosynthesis
MKILIVHNILWAHYKSAVFQSLYTLIQQQPASAAVEINVIQIARNERSRAGLEADNAPEAPRYNYDYDLLFDQFIEDVPLLARTRALLSRMQAFRPDVLYLTGYYDPAQLILLLWAKLTGVRVLMQNESTAVDNPKNTVRDALKRLILSQCDGFFCFGTMAANYLTDLGVPSRKILMRKNAVDNHALLLAYQRAVPNRVSEQKRLGLKPRNLIFVGRLIEVKNLIALLNAFAETKTNPKNNDWGLLFLGDGPMAEPLQKHTDKLGLTEVVRFLPGRAWYRVPAVLALADVLVLPSRSEPWGLVVNEAMVCGLPVVVSDKCGCVADLLHDGQNGLVIDPDQPNQLTDALTDLMAKSGTDRAVMGRIGQEIIAPFSPQAVAAEMLAGFVNNKFLGRDVKVQSAV